MFMPLYYNRQSDLVVSGQHRGMEKKIHVMTLSLMIELAFTALIPFVAIIYFNLSKAYLFYSV